MRIHLPLEIIQDNPFQSEQRDYSDIDIFATEEIAPFFDTRPETLGLQAVPQVRLLNTSGDLANTDEVDDHLTGLTVQLIFGHRRKRAIEHLAQHDDRYKDAKLPVDVVQLNDEQMLAEVYGENSFRKGTSAIEQLSYLQHAMDMLGEKGTLKQAAEILNMNPSRARNLWRLRNLSPELQQANADGRLSQALCEELLAVEKIRDNMNGIPNLVSEVGSWKTPHPNAVIKQAIENDATRDDVRSYVDQFQKQRGRQLHPILLDEQIDHMSVRQPGCKQCPAKLKTHCIDRTCHTIKMAVAARRIAQQEFPSLSWSDDKDHFKRWDDYNTARHLLEYVDQLETLQGEEDLVIGVVLQGTAARPLTKERHHIYIYEEESNPRHLLAFGYKQKRLPTPDPDDSALPSEEIERIEAEQAVERRFESYDQLRIDSKARLQANTVHALYEHLLSNIRKESTPLVAALVSALRRDYDLGNCTTDVQMIRGIAELFSTHIVGWSVEKTKERALHLADHFQIPDHFAPDLRLTDAEKAAALLTDWKSAQYWNREEYAERIANHPWLDELITDGTFDEQIRDDLKAMQSEVAARLQPQPA